MPELLTVALPALLPPAGNFAGGLLYLLAQALIEGAVSEEGEGTSRMWMIYLAVATDLFGDGLLLGAGASVSAGLGLALALGQVLADIPTSSRPCSPSGPTASHGPAGSCSQRPSSFRHCWARRSRTRSCETPSKRCSTPRSWSPPDCHCRAFEDMTHEAHEDPQISTLTLIGGFALLGFVSGALG